MNKTVLRGGINKWIKKHCKECVGLKVLEVGVGHNTLKNTLFKKCSVVSVDKVNSEWVDQVCNAKKLPFGNECFDVVTCIGVLEHEYDFKSIVGEMKRVLKVNGVIFLTVPDMFPVHDSPDDFFRFTEFGVRRLFEPFVVLDVFKMGVGCFTLVGNYLIKKGEEE